MYETLVSNHRPQTSLTIENAVWAALPSVWPKHAFLRMNNKDNTFIQVKYLREKKIFLITNFEFGQI